jgi:bifunctional UDP-N-acetylglucosamine pyrophosphorylase / glucosamine-1-phosphate N-acetyltransferase
MIADHVGAVILAAGKGTRMHSSRPKVLFELLAEPMLWYLYQTLDPMFPGRVWTVLGHEAERVRASFPGRPQEGFVLQEPQNGTGHALQCAWSALRHAGMRHVLVVNGDTPLLPAETAHTFVRECLERGAALGCITLTLEDPAAFGRVVRKDGRLTSIVEAKDYDHGLHGPETGEINAGIYFLDIEAMEPHLGRLRNSNKSGEYYITDLLGMAVEAGLVVHGFDAGNDSQLLGINSPAELVAAEERLRESVVASWQRRHVCIRQPESVRIGPRVEIAPGVCITGPCEIYGSSRIEAECEIESHCVLRNAILEGCVLVKSFSHVQDAHMGACCQVGPYARLRPGAVLERDARVGNFVEMKKAVLGQGAKASHLTYLGDTTVGAGSNIGAGTITCNYDGKHKHETVIGKGAFIGSNTALVAPVTIGDNALVGAGSVITKDVPDNALAVTRAHQVTKPRKRDA